MAVKKQGKKKRKPSAMAYVSQGRALKNKRIKLARHQKDNPNDKQIVGTIPNYKPRKEQVDFFGKPIKHKGVLLTKRKRG